MNDHIRTKFPVVQRSRTTVSGSGIPGSVAQLLHPPQPNVPGLRLIQTHLLYEDGSETPKGSFTPGKSDFLAHFPAAHQNLAVDTEDLRLVHRPTAPALKDKDARRIHLPRKTVVPKKAKRKRRAKGRKIMEYKRPRHDSPNQERQYNPLPRRRVPLKSVTAAHSNNRSWPSPTRERQYHAPKVQQRARRVPLKSTRFAAMSAPPTNRHGSPGEDIQPLHSSPEPGYRRSSGKIAGLVPQRGRKTLLNQPLSPVMTPTPPPPNRSDASALEEIAYGIARLDPLLARYSARSAPLFLSRNLRDGWTEKVRVWDKDGASTQERCTPVPDQLVAREERFKTFVAEALRRAPTAMSDVTKAPLPRTFCLKLRGFDLGHLAKFGLPNSAQIAATLYIRNPSSDPISFYLGSFPIGIPQSTANFFTTPYRIPPSGNLDTIYDGPRRMASLFMRTSGRDEEHNLSLRALTLPGGIAYIDLLLYDFADESMDLQGISLTWSAANATQVYARVEIAGPNAGPNGFSTATQRVPLVWLRDEYPGGSRNKPGVRAEHQPQAFLNVELEWGVDSAAPFLRPRIPKPLPRGASTPSRNIKLVYRLSLQGGDHVLEVEKSTWTCVLCNICASFPTQHILKVHLRRAHPQVETKFNKMRRDPVTGQDRFDVRVILPPEAIELSDDDEEAPVTQTVAPSTRIGALLAASDTDVAQQVDTEGSGFGVAGTIPSTPPRVTLNSIKEEEEHNENWPTDGMDLLPINRGRSHSPTPALDSPVRQRRDHGPSSPTSPTRPNRLTPAPEPFVGVYSSRIHNKPRIYDVLRHLPMHYGLLNGQIIANEEEMFGADYISDGLDGYEAFAEEAMLMGALWSRWMATEKNRFIANPFECLSRFVSSFYLDVIIDYVGYRCFVRFMLDVASRGRIKLKEAAVLCRKYKAREQELAQSRRAQEQ